MFDNGMWMIWAIIIVPLPLVGLVLHEWWHNRQVEKYEEWEKEQAEQEKEAAAGL